MLLFIYFSINSQMHNNFVFNIFRSPSLQFRALEPSSYILSFSNKLSLPVFTGSKLEDVDNRPLQIFLMNTEGGQQFRTSLPQPIKIEIVVLDGDFLSDEREDWSSEEFNNKIVRERAGKRPLLTGDVAVTLRDGYASIGEFSFTDNSSWIRSRHFRLGARVAPGSYQGARIREAKTEPFIVKDHRGECKFVLLISHNSLTMNLACFLD
uniref:Calmodulin binding protein-like N-terminal domain-containing protein n=1 Tax=Nelumbo nucifera TaxID=4432 RepID=A0A822YLR3_NELNU|nr:TPA_asm: hypothetical protein HUJ06_010697 [Nelumbo nucifera]